MAKRVGVVGVGAMGKPMAASLLRAGYEVTVCPHRNKAPVEELAAKGARAVANPREVGENSDVVITMVPDAPQVEESIFGENGIAHGLHKGGTVIDMSTISFIATRQFAERLEAMGMHMLDAPVSGGPARAETGQLTIMVGGDKQTYEQNEDVLKALGNPRLLGPIGMGEVVKLCNNVIIASEMIAMAEAFTFAAKAGADVNAVREVLMTATAGNYLMDKWLPQNMLVNKYDPGFALELMQKDIGAALSAGKDMGVPMMMTGLAFQLYQTMKGLGDGRSDYSAISKLYQESANVTIATGKPWNEKQ